MNSEPADKKTIVFCGSTVSRKDLEKFFCDPGNEIIFAPPAGLGDVWKHIRADTAAMVIIDCIHSKGPSVWHREILSALDAGIAVFGAGGMGALRAAELTAMGMTGVGSVFKLLKNGIFEADDEVLSGTDGFALVTLRLALEKLTADCVLTRKEADQMTTQVKDIFYDRRSWHQIYLWLQNNIELARRQKAISYLQTHARDPRPDDAAAAVRLALTDSGRPGSGFGMGNCVTAMLNPKWRLSEMYHRCFVFNQAVFSGAKILAMAEDLQKDWSHELKSAFFVRQWLKEKKINPPTDFVSAYVEKEISKKTQFFDFLMENALTFKEWKGLLEQKSQVVWARQMSHHLLMDFPDKNCFAGAWAADHGIKPAPGSGLTSGQWVVEKGPEHFGFIWEESAEFFDALRLSGRAAHFAAMSSQEEACNG